MANIDKFHVGQIVAHENSNIYNEIIAIGASGVRVVDRYMKSDRRFYETVILTRNTTGYELYDPTPEIAKFYNVYDTGGAGVAWESLQEAKNKVPDYVGAEERCVGHLEVVRKGGTLIRTVWHEREKK